jgi:hypothetical protein
LRSRWLRQECDEQEEHDSGLLVTGEASLQLQRRIPLTNLLISPISAQSWLGVLTIPLLASSQFAQSSYLTRICCICIARRSFFFTFFFGECSWVVCFL